jgi:hypothetical protein
MVANPIARTLDLFAGRAGPGHFPDPGDHRDGTGGRTAHPDRHPMPYQAQLDQAVAAKARDEALLTTARLDLTRYKKLVAQGVATVKNDQAQIEAEMPSCRAGRIAGRVGSYVDDNAVPRLTSAPMRPDAPSPRALRVSPRGGHVAASVVAAAPHVGNAA